MKYLYPEINVYSYIKIFTSKANLFSVGAFRNYHCQAFWKCVTTKRCFNYILKFIFYSLHYYSLKYYHFFLLLYMHSIVVVILCSKNKIDLYTLNANFNIISRSECSRSNSVISLSAYSITVKYFTHIINLVLELNQNNSTHNIIYKILIRGVCTEILRNGSSNSNKVLCVY